MNCGYKPEDMLDRQIKSALRNRAEEVAVSAGLDEAVWQAVDRAKLNRGVSGVFARLWSCLFEGRRFFGRKLLAAFCALFCLSCCGVMATVGVGESKGWVSHVGLDSRFSDYESLASVVANLDFTPQYVESLAGGFQFQEGHISQVQRLDENGHRMSHIYKQLFIDYLNAESGEVVILSVSNTPSEDYDVARQSVSRQIGEIELVYTAQPYKFVPVDYVLTDEDKAALADGSLEISVGTADVERTLNASVVWTQDGVKYILFGWDLTLSAEEMLDMAADFIEQTGGSE